MVDHILSPHDGVATGVVVVVAMAGPDVKVVEVDTVLALVNTRKIPYTPFATAMMIADASAGITPERPPIAETMFVKIVIQNSVVLYPGFGFINYPLNELILVSHEFHHFRSKN